MTERPYLSTRVLCPSLHGGFVVEEGCGPRKIPWLAVLLLSSLIPVTLTGAFQG